MRINIRVRHIAVSLGINEKFFMEFLKEQKVACKNAEYCFNGDAVDIFS